MKKLLGLFIVVSLFFISSTTYAQLIDEKNVTVTMDLQPILQLNMTTPDQVEFIFDDIKSYYAGIVKYGATILKVSSSVSWDLYAVGTSTNGDYWDQQMAYGALGANAVSNLPLSALELHQYEANQYTDVVLRPDYSAEFIPATSWALGDQGVNSIYHATNAYLVPTAADKYLQGTKGTALAAVGPPIVIAQGAPGGSYLIEKPKPVLGVVTFSAFYFTIDYRIVPSLPATFPFAGTNAAVSEAVATYAQPGVYTMDVKYVLLEDQ